MHLISPSRKLKTSKSSLNLSSVKAGHSLGFRYFTKILASVSSHFSAKPKSAFLLPSSITAFLKCYLSILTFLIDAGINDQQNYSLCVPNMWSLFRLAQFHSFEPIHDKFGLGKQAGKISFFPLLAKKLLEQAGWPSFHWLNLGKMFLCEKNINKKLSVNFPVKYLNEEVNMSITTSPLSNCLRSLKSAAASRILHLINWKIWIRVKGVANNKTKWTLIHLLNSMQNACTSIKSSCNNEF